MTNTELKLFALTRLKEISNNGDTEIAHCDADSVLCLILEKLGFEDVVKAFENIEKWYA